MASTRVLLRERPTRAIALVTPTHVLTFRHSTPGGVNASKESLGSQHGSFPGASNGSPRCVVELSSAAKADLTGFKTISSNNVHGTLGMITVNNDVFLCVVSSAARVATVRPGETIEQIGSVDFHCLNKPDYDRLLHDNINVQSMDMVDEDGFEHDQNGNRKDPTFEHPCHALRKLLSGGSFYYSADFDVTSRLQTRSTEMPSFDFDAFDKGYLWNSYMIKPLLDFRTRLSDGEREVLDSTRLLTAAIRGFAQTIPIPAQFSPARIAPAGLPSTLTVISRLSCRRAGTRFNARGIDDEGAVANYVESETVFWSPAGLAFSYVQIRGSIPLFWEQAAGFLPGQQKITITRSPQATQPAFNKHFEDLELKYGPIHVVNLLSKDKSGEVELSKRYQSHIDHCSLNGQQDGTFSSEHRFVRETDYDFHAETRSGYDAASGIRRYIQDSADSFGYCLTEIIEEHPQGATVQDEKALTRPIVILQQEGVFRTNCLDCLDRTNLVQTIISQMGIEAFLAPRGERPLSDFWARHGSLWADNGDALSKIYAGTGALKSSYTRSGKMSLAGALADARKSATRLYINNFADKDRQITMDMLLGRLIGQTAVYLYDPLNDYVQSETSRRASEYSSSREIKIWTGTYNLNGRTHGINEDLSPWLCPPLNPALQNADIVAVGFQEIVELSPQHIMSTDPSRRQDWEKAVRRILNNNAKAIGSDEYVILRGGQLVGCSLSIFVKVSILHNIKNVEGALKKTGMSGMAGNKGAVAIRMDIDNTSICFVTAHLAAGFANYEERNRDYKTISHGLRFQRNRAIEDHDNIIWLGDFNYRIGLNDESARKLCKIGTLEALGRLYENDQLNLQMVAGLTFPYYAEARIHFAPTYKYDVGTDNYDTSEKSRIPAWCDRILRKGNDLRQTSYDTAALRFSDHRPVYATFNCRVQLVDERVKHAISREIYMQRKTMVTSSANDSAGDDSGDDDEDLIGYESIEAGLPPASSDRRKWWLDGGLPARSKVEPPPAGFVPNPNAVSNPFTISGQPAWMQSAKLSDRLATNTATASVQKRSDQARGRSPSAASSSSPISRKPAPPVPRKPDSLSGSPSLKARSPTSPTNNSGNSRTPLPPPPAGRSTLEDSKPRMRPATVSTGATTDLLGLDKDNDDDDNMPTPKLPRRSGAGGLMDDDDVVAAGSKDTAEGLGSWIPLKPG